MTCPRIEGAAIVPVQGHIQDPRIAVEHVLCAVTMVYVPVHNQHAPQAPAVDARPSRHRHLVVEAEAHGFVRLCVVARWPHQRHAPLRGVAGNCLCHRQRVATSQLSRSQCVGIGECVALKEV